MVPLTRLKKVVLPAPLGPMIALTLPCSMVVVTSLTAVRPPKRLETLRISSTAGSRFGRAGADGRTGRRLRTRAPRTPAQVRPPDAVRQEDHQRHQDRAEDHEAVLLQELQVLSEPG